MPDIDFIQKYQEALACYSEEDFERIFNLAGIEGDELRTLGKDYLGMAGAFYLSMIERQTRHSQKSETLRHLAKAQRASRDLAEHLGKALQEPSMINALMEASLTARTAFPDDEAKNRDSYKILDSIFPLSGIGQGFRYEGLSHALAILAECIARVESDAIKKPARGRKTALRPWILLMYTYWHQAKGEPPRTGHYDAEIAEYDSPSMAALSLAAERLDPELTSRALASSIGPTSDAFANTLEEPLLLAAIGFAEIIAADVSVSSKDTLERHLGMPPGFTANLSGVAPPPATSTRENSIVSKEEFFETLKSSVPGQMLLQCLIDIRES